MIAAVTDMVEKLHRSPEVAACAVAASTCRALREARHNAESSGSNAEALVFDLTGRQVVEAQGQAAGQRVRAAAGLDAKVPPAVRDLRGVEPLGVKPVRGKYAPTQGHNVVSLRLVSLRQHGLVPRGRNVNPPGAPHRAHHNRSSLIPVQLGQHLQAEWATRRTAGGTMSSGTRLRPIYRWICSRFSA